MAQERSLKDRFNSKYVADDTGCWLWTGRLNQHGYGVFVIGHSKTFLAHRVSFELHSGLSIPDGKCVLHSCDVRRCVNPSHLRIGTQAENVADMMERNRHKCVRRYGEANPSCKLTDEQVRQIRGLYVPRKVTLAQLAARFGVSQALLSLIVNGERRRGGGWKTEEF